MQLIWFRCDLRLDDNEIVSKACHDGGEVLPCFVIDPWFYQQPEIACCRVKFLFESLENLDSNLRKRGSQLYLFEGKSVEVIQTITRSLIKLGKQPKLYFNRDIQVNYGIACDRAIIKFYQQQSLEIYLGRNHFLQETENYDTIWLDYHDYQERPLHPTPQAIDTPQVNLDLPQLTIAQLKHKYQRFLEAKSYRYLGGEDNRLALPIRCLKLLESIIRPRIYRIKILICSLSVTETNLTASAGVSINKFLAKIASGMNKPNGMTVILPEEAEAFVESLPIEKFHGIGKVTAAKMRSLKIMTGADLKERSLEYLVQSFGKAGHYYYNIARAKDNRAVEANRIRKSIGAENSFAENLSDEETIIIRLKQIAQTLKKRIDRHQASGRTLTLKVKFSDYQQITRSRTFEVGLCCFASSL